MQRALTLLLAVLLGASGSAAAWLERGYQPESMVHVEEPGGPTSAKVDHHNHAFCAVLGSAAGLPQTGAPPQLGHSLTCDEPKAEPGTLAGVFRFSTLHSRAPPTV